MERNIQDIEGCMKALSDRTRLRIVKLLQAGPLCGCQLAAVLDFSAATVSNHLSVLTEAGFLKSEKRGRWVYFSLVPDNNEAASLLPLLQYWLNGDAVVKADRKRLASADTDALCG